MKEIVLTLVMICFLGVSPVLIAQENSNAEYRSVGKEFKLENVLSESRMTEKYAQMNPGDTVQVKFMADVNTVCKNKGCWMKLDMAGNEEVMVKFEDYSFFVPKDIEEKEVIVHGKAYVTEMSVDDQRHYAEDEGKSPAEVAAITQPKRTWSFMAEGVKIKE